MTLEHYPGMTERAIAKIVEGGAAALERDRLHGGSIASAS
jgi:hypothetical protein